jgi:hypothetical protein
MIDALWISAAPCNALAISHLHVFLAHSYRKASGAACRNPARAIAQSSRARDYFGQKYGLTLRTRTLRMGLPGSAPKLRQDGKRRLFPLLI